MQQYGEYQGPLAGLNVIDFGHYYAGPLVGMLLADQGATVIRIVRPGKPELPEQQYRVFNRNKKLLTLDFKTEEGRRQALSLIMSADVVIENFRPGVMKRLGMDYASVKGDNPGLVYLSLPGFASTDKERAHLQAWEGIMNAAAGVFTETSQYRQYLGYPPVYTWIPQCSMYGGMNGAIAIMAALVARESHGQGTVLEAPLADGALYGFTYNFFLKTPSGTLRAISKPNDGLPDHLQPLKFSDEDDDSSMREKLDKARHLLETTPFGKHYPCSDGRYIFIFTFDICHISERFLKVLELDKQVKREGFVNEGPWEVTLDNNISNGALLNTERRRRLEQLISEAFLTRTAEEWETVLGEAGVPASFTRTREEWLENKAMLESGVFAEIDNGSLKLKVSGRLADVSGPEGTLMNGFNESVPITIDDAKQLFNGHARLRSQSAVLSQKMGDLLKDLRIVDLANVAAGPIAGNILAQYGAKVIKADPPLYIHPGMVLTALPILQGKRSILTDVKTAPGREIFERLIARVDVVLHNVLDDSAERLGVSHQALKSINPNVIGCQLSAFGGALRGFWEKRPGFDNILQNATGVMAQFGTLEEPHWHGNVSCTDVMGGFTLAYSALLGVYQQRKSGYAGEVRTSLARVVNYAQLPYMIAQDGKSDWGEARGQFAVGEHWWQRMYRCRDLWIYVGTSEDRATMLTEAVLGQGDGNEKMLEEAFAKQDGAFWLTKLDAANIACHQVMSVDDICDAVDMRTVDNEEADETVTGGYEILLWKHHSYGPPIILAAPHSVRVGENHSVKRLRVAPRLGENTIDILKELGYNEKEIAELIRTKVSHEYLPALGSKDVYYFGQKKESL